MAIARYGLFMALWLVLLHCPAFAADEKKCEWHTHKDPGLCSYEPNTLGYTKDSDDNGFLDFKLSVRYQLIPAGTTGGFNHLYDGLGDNSAWYLAFTGRFGQYIESRDSSPVVAKRFNPKTFFRYWTDEEHRDYIDISPLAHESNGQSIDSAAEYQSAQTASKKPQFADDELSRGWDYLEAVWKKDVVPVGRLGALSTVVTLKYFLPYGPLQGRAEDYNAWENNPQGKQRSHVNGIAGAIQLHDEFDWRAFSHIKIAAMYETGYREIFRYSTVRFEFSATLFQLPLNFWGQSGYGSDLAQYYKKVDSYGVALEIGGF